MDDTFLHSLYKIVSFNNVMDGLQILGIRKGDAIFVHSSLSKFGFVEGGARTVINAIRETIGSEGTIIMPSFNMSIFSQEPIILDTLKTPSEMGIISETFRCDAKVNRNSNLFHPLCFQGPLAKSILKCQTIDTWGEDSPYDLLFREKVKILLLGTNFYTTSFFHFCEQRNSVPYREPVTYHGFVNNESGALASTCIRLKRKFGAESDFNVLYKLFNKNNNIIGDTASGTMNMSEAIIGTAICRSLNAAELVNLCDKLLKKDPCFFKLQSDQLSTMPTMIHEDQYQMFNLIEALYKKNRALVSDDFNGSLKWIRDYIPLRYHFYPSQSKAWTWEIPPKWSVIEASVIDAATGEKLIDTKNNLLHVRINSTPIHKKVSREELFEHLAFRRDFPDAIPYTTGYYKNSWGFSIKADELAKFSANQYNVNIDSTLTPGNLVVGEYTVHGFGDKTILFPIHLDHPWQCNDNLSGCAVALELILKLSRCFDLKNSYTFLFLPETIGTIAYLSNHELLIPNVRYGLVFDSVGNINTLKFTQTKKNDDILNRYIHTVLKSNKISYETLEFYDDEHLISANDERVLSSPFVNIPSVAFSRSPFKEYHTDKDSPAIINEAMLNETVKVLFEIIMLIEKDFRPQQKFKGVLHLSSYGLWDDSWTIDENLSIEKILHSLTGEYTVFEIAERVSKSFDFVYQFLIKLQEKGLLTVL